MKKIIIAVLACLYTVVAQAQFDIITSSCQAYVVYPMRAGVSLSYMRLKNNEAYYYLRLNTSNKYSSAIHIWLGNREKTIATLTQMINELYKEGESYYLTDDNGESFTALCSKQLGAKGYAIHKAGHAGYAYVRLSQIEKMIELL